MHKNSSVMPIFKRSSGILKRVMSLVITSAPGLGCLVGNRRSAAKHLARVSLLGRAGFHFVSLGLLARRNQVGTAALRFDLLHRRLGKMMRLDDEPLRDLAAAKNANAV